MRADARRNYERIVATAREVFFEHGIDAPLDDIAKRAQVGAGTLYRHFPTRERADRGRLPRARSRSWRTRAYALAKELPPEEALREWMREQVRFVVERPGLAVRAEGGHRRGLRDLPLLQGEAARRRSPPCSSRRRRPALVRADLEPSDLMRLGHGIGAAAKYADDGGHGTPAVGRAGRAARMKWFRRKDDRRRPPDAARPDPRDARRAVLVRLVRAAARGGRRARRPRAAAGGEPAVRPRRRPAPGPALLARTRSAGDLRAGGQRAGGPAAAPVHRRVARRRARARTRSGSTTTRCRRCRTRRLVTVNLGAHRIPLADVRVVAQVDEAAGVVDVAVYHPEMAALDEAARNAMTYLPLDAALGERLAAERLRRVETAETEPCGHDRVARAADPRARAARRLRKLSVVVD